MTNETRALLIANMQSLASRGLDCRACQGECCTSRSNSMMITPQEADDILLFLRESGRWTGELRQQLKDNIRDYRLDVELPHFGARRNLRRTYTCPFYKPGPEGCSLPSTVKPHGCLAFNAVQSEARGLQDGCRSDQNLLSQSAPPDEGSEKQPIPLALLSRGGL